MVRIANDVTKLVGHTPLVRLNRVSAGAVATVVAKLESYNPLGSVKDRIAVEIAKRPENAGKLIVVLLPDTGERYLSTALFAEQ